MRLKDKVAIITAGGSGAGRAGALLFAEKGAKVVVGDIDSKKASQTVDMIKEKGGDAKFVQADVGIVDELRQLIDTTINTYNKLDILWNHAGMPGPGILENTDEADFDRSMAVNIKSGFFASKYAVPHMKKAGGGSIIFTASIAALRASPWSPSYSLFKGGLIPFTMSLAAYLAPYNIRANCICPGLIDSPMAREFMDRSNTLGSEKVEKAIKEFEKRIIPLGRTATPSNIARVALFLASNDASYITGVSVPVDGGIITKAY